MSYDAALLCIIILLCAWNALRTHRQARLEDAFERERMNYGRAA